MLWTAPRRVEGLSLIVLLDASRWPPQIVIRYPPMALPPRHISEEHYGWMLRPPRPDVAEYNDDDILTEYIWRHYSRLLTAAEARAGIYVPALDRETATRIKSASFADYLDRTHGAVDAAGLATELRDGRAALFRRARDRILENYKSLVFINRCPACNRIVRSPGARQCLWCNHDWHTGEGG
jgi:hypothetical protein